MRYNDHLTMLPEKAFQVTGKKLKTLEGGGGGKSAPPPPAAPAPIAEPAPLEPAKGSTTSNDQQTVAANRQGTKDLRIDLGGAATGGGSGLTIPT
jgi:hypothetical protein